MLTFYLLLLIVRHFPPFFYVFVLHNLLALNCRINIEGSFSAIGEDSWSKLGVKVRASKLSPIDADDKATGNVVVNDIENVRLGVERGIAGDVYRSLISSLAPWREKVPSTVLDSPKAASRKKK